MPIREIVKYPDERLKLVSEQVGDNLEGMAQLVRDMAETMYAANGAGLAAIQVGLPIRLFIVDSDIAGGNPAAPPLVFIDPEIIFLGKETEVDDEGCLSFPDIFVPVERSVRCRTRARDVQGKIFEVEGEGLFARCMQHENDHLNGCIISDYVGPLKRKMIARRMARDAAAAKKKKK